MHPVPLNHVELSVVVPMYNEEDNIDLLFESLISVINRLNISYEVICIDDGSTDNTFKKLLDCYKKNAQIKIIRFSRNFGKEIAVTAGLNYSSGQAVVPIDSDLQDPPEVIEQLLNKWREGYDVVYAVRQSRPGEGPLKRFTAHLFYRVINLLSNTPIPKDTGDFRLFDRRVVEVLNKIPERTRFMKGLFAWVGFRQVGVPYDREPRRLGRTKWNYWKLWNFALDAVTLFSTIPLRLWSYIGFVISLLSFLYGAFLIIRTLILGVDVPGYASIMVAILFLGGLQLISLGIIGEYLGRVYAEAKARPLYVVKERYGFDSVVIESDHHQENRPEENLHSYIVDQKK
jgi:glycosyltransferase involved in cell wall biosynthesis